MLRRVEVGLTGGKIDDIDAFGAQFAGFGGDRQGDGRFDQFGSFCQLTSSQKFLNV